MKKQTLAAAALAACALCAAPDRSGAAELTYIDHDNVVVENVDGSARHALSTDGTPARPYVLPSGDPAGNIVAFQPSAADGRQEIVFWVLGSGAPLRHRMPRSPGDTTTSPPTSARMQPDGPRPVIAYTFLAFGDPAQPRYGRSWPEDPTLADAQTSVDYVDLTWHRERPVVARPDGNVYWTGSSKVMLAPNEPGTKLTFAEVSADGTRVLVRSTDADGGQRLALFAYEGEIPFGEITAGCALPIGAGFARGALSRDGTTVAWDDNGGVHVARAEPDRFDAGFTCVLDGARIASASGRMPSFSEASTTLPPGDGAGGGTPPGGGGGGATTTPGPTTTTTKPPVPTDGKKTTTRSFTITVPAAIKATTLRRGVTLKAAAPAAGRISLTLRRGSRTLATASGTASRAGTVKLRLKAKRGARGLAGKASLTAKFTPRSGRATSRKLTVRVR